MNENKGGWEDLCIAFLGELDLGFPYPVDASRFLTANLHQAGSEEAVHYSFLLAASNCYNAMSPWSRAWELLSEIM